MTGTRRSTVNRRRKGPLAFVIPWLKRFGVFMAALAIGGWLGSWLLLSGAMQRGGVWSQEKILQASASMGFEVENILIEGRVYTNADVLRAALNMEKGDPLFSFDPAEAREMLRRINWIKNAQVERRLPGTIYVRLEEKKPVALWQKDGNLALLDEAGVVITTENLDRFKDLVIVMGDGAPDHTAELVRNIEAEPVLKEKIRAAKWIDGRRWDLVFASGVTAKLPEKEMGLALRRLAQAEEQDKVLTKDILALDLREEGRITVQTKPGAAQDYDAAIKTGSNI